MANTSEEQARTPSVPPTADAGRGATRPHRSKLTGIIALGMLLLAGGIGYQINQTRALSREVATLKAQLDADRPDEVGIQTNQSPAVPGAPGAWPFGSPDLDLDHWDPRAELQRMQQDMNQLFGTSFSRFHMSPQFGSLFESRAFSPSVDVEETEDAFLVTVDVPGVSETNIKVEVENNVLHIHGETNREAEGSESKGQIVRRERFEGRFERTIPLPSAVDTAKMTSKYENGVLRVTLPKEVESSDSNAKDTSES